MSVWRNTLRKYESLDNLEGLGVDWKIILKANISNMIQICVLHKSLQGYGTVSGFVKTAINLLVRIFREIFCMSERLSAFQQRLRYLNLVRQLDETCIKYTKVDSTRFQYKIYGRLLLGFSHRSNVTGIWICAATKYDEDKSAV